MSREKIWEDPAPMSRAESIRRMQIGDSISITRRVDLTHSIAEDLIHKLNSAICTALSVQGQRTKLEYPEREFEVRSGQFMRDGNHLFIVSVLTRLL